MSFDTDTDNLPATLDNYARHIVWENGCMKLVGVPVRPKPTKDRLKECLDLSLDFPYDGHDPRYVGLTKGEAMMVELVDRATRGDYAALKEVLDRSLGKPIQNIRSVSVRATLEEFLDGLPPPPDTPQRPPKATTVDVSRETSHKTAQQEADEI